MCCGPTAPSASTAWKLRVPWGPGFCIGTLWPSTRQKLNTYGKGKQILRKAFEGDWLPESILWREKAAFSDAGWATSMVDDLKEYAEETYTDRDLPSARGQYTYALALYQGKPAVPGTF